MARYRKVHVKMWGDEKFTALTPPAPNGQTLWMYLMTGPHTNALPGLFSAGEAALAEALGWPLKGFREAFREVFGKGMAKADWKARLVFLPRAMVYNPPESPNVVKAWRAAFEELPECQLKREAFQAFKDFLEGLPKAFVEAFGEDLPKALPKALPNQEQEQEQEQEHEKTLSRSAERAVEFETFWQAYPGHRRKEKAEARKAWGQVAAGNGFLARVLEALARQKRDSDWTRDEGRYVPYPAKWLRRKRWEDDVPVEEPYGFER